MLEVSRRIILKPNNDRLLGSSIVLYLTRLIALLLPPANSSPKNLRSAAINAILAPHAEEWSKGTYGTLRQGLGALPSGHRNLPLTYLPLINNAYSGDDQRPIGFSVLAMDVQGKPYHTTARSIKRLNDGEVLILFDAWGILIKASVCHKCTGPVAIDVSPSGFQWGGQRGRYQMFIHSSTSLFCLCS